MANVAMLGTGLIGLFYTMSLHGKRSRDKVVVVHGRDPEKTRAFAQKWGIPRWTTSLEEAVSAADVELVVIGLPNHLHLEAVQAAARAGKGVLCTKPLARTAAEARQILDLVEKAGVFHGYLEDLVYTPKTRKALESVRKGSIGRVLWTRSREAHPGPHSDWFWTKEISGGGAIVDLGCHTIEIGRSFVGKDVRPVEVVCWGATQVHPIEAEDSAIGIVRYASGAVAQFEVAWTFRGGMDLRDEVSGTEGSIFINHWLRTGLEMFSAPGAGGYVAEKAETESGWLFPVGDEVSALGYDDMFADMLDAFEQKRAPAETFYDGYVVNAIMDACYRSMETKRWEPVALDDWRGKAEAESAGVHVEYDARHWLIKLERMPDGRKKLILKDKQTGAISQRVE
ncbi:MAG TPA: Gfo/Idh/MocA family oxidoreductase [Vicinamibacteria bacterium]|nr:Gfo/Idh/MocA family oxidoreductase [Vicinamibacteria bacterium]